MTKPTERFFRQIDLSPEHLDQGFFGPHNQIAPFNPILFLDPKALEMFKNAGVRFARSSDDLDLLEGAVLKLLPENEIISVVQHLRAPVKGIEIHAYGNGKNPLLLNALDRNFSIKRDLLVWQREDVNYP